MYEDIIPFPIKKPEVRGRREIKDLLEETRKKIKDSFLKSLIDYLTENDVLEVTYKNSKGEEIQTNLLHQVRRAYENQFHVYEKVSNEMTVWKIAFALADVLHREDAKEAYARLVNEKEVMFSGLDYRMKGQAIKLTNPPLRLVNFYGNSFRLREFGEGEFLKHLSMLFTIKEREYRLKQDYSPQIRNALQDLKEYLLPEFF